MAGRLMWVGLMSLGVAGSALAGLPRCGVPRRPVRCPTVAPQAVRPASYRAVRRRVWVEPLYEVRTHRVWVAEPCNRLHVRIGSGGFSLGVNLGRRRCCGHYETIRERVCVRPGGWQVITERVLVEPPRVESVVERTCTRPGLRVHRRGGYRRPSR